MKKSLYKFLPADKFSVRLLMLVFVFGILGVHSAFAGITITPASWNVIGLDSNNVSVGPNLFPVGTRVCNTGGAAVTNVTAKFVWDSANAFINIDANQTDTQTLSSLAANSCIDFYYDISVTRSTLAYNATRRFHITAVGDGVSLVSTPTPRELYVEKLVSQNRNSVQSIIGPSTVYVGQTYNYTVNASTATGGYEQLEAFLSLSNVVFRVLAIATTYTAPTGGTNDKFYADACGWDNNPLNSTYRSCIGPAVYSGGKAGGKVKTTYTVLVISTGITTATTLIYDFSGSSYHYNADYGNQIISITALPPLASDLTISKSHTGNFTAGSTGIYNLTVTNGGTASTVGTITVSDALPAGLTVNGGLAGVAAISGANAANWACSSNAAAPQIITCTSSTAISNIAGSNTSVFNFSVSVGLGTAVGTNSITNTASVSGGGDSNTANNSASDPTTVLSPNLTIAKTHTGIFPRGGTGTYTITLTNAGTAPTSAAIIVTDTLPTGLSVNGGSAGVAAISGANAANWACNSNAAAPQVITCTSSTAISNVAGSNTSVFTFTVNVAGDAAASVTNNASVAGGGEATANGDNNSASDPTTTVAAPSIGLSKSCPNPATCTTAPQLSGTDLTYRIQFTNTGGQTATAMMILDAIPLNTDFKVGTAQTSVGTSGLVFTIEYSNNYSSASPALATWAYVPASAGGGAAAGYDRNVKAVRWRVSAGTLSNIAPNNTGNVSFTVRIR